MSVESNGHEHEFEPAYGLPEALPADEKILWQGSPDFGTVARCIFHVRKVALYFAVVLAWRAGDVLVDGGGWVVALKALPVHTLLAAMAMVAVVGLAWLTARTAVYTITDKRIVMRIGIVLTLTFNLPLRLVQSAALRTQDRGCGDIVITMGGEDRIAWLQLWPHVRPWKLARAQPMLRAVPDAAKVSALLGQAWAASTGAAVNPEKTPAQATPADGQRRWQASPT